MTLTTPVDDARVVPDDRDAGVDGWTTEPIAAAPNRLVLAALIGVPAVVLAAGGLVVIWRLA